MKNIGFILSFFLFSFCISSCQKETKSDASVIIPQPLSLTTDISSGSFHLSSQTSIALNIPEEHVGEVSQWFINLPAQLVSAENPKVGNQIEIKLSSDTAKYTTAEDYGIEITNQLIKLEARGLSGLFYASQSLLQLYEAAKQGEIVNQIINDSPRFEHRGLLLDVSRYFFEVAFIKKQIDMMAHYKMNKLMLYVAGDGGWRLEIEKYPWLSELAAWRTEQNYALWEKGEQEFCNSKIAEAYGGSYSSAEIKELVEYANSHFVEIIPMIEMPCSVPVLANAYKDKMSCYD